MHIRTSILLGSLSVILGATACNEADSSANGRDGADNMAEHLDGGGADAGDDDGDDGDGDAGSIGGGSSDADVGDGDGDAGSIGGGSSDADAGDGDGDADAGDGDDHAGTIGGGPNGLGILAKAKVSLPGGESIVEDHYIEAFYNAGSLYLFEWNGHGGQGDLVVQFRESVADVIPSSGEDVLPYIQSLSFLFSHADSVWACTLLTEPAPDIELSSIEPFPGASNPIYQEVHGTMQLSCPEKTGSLEPVTVALQF